MKRRKTPSSKIDTNQANNHYLVWLLYRLDIQPGPGDLVGLNTQDGHAPCRMLLTIYLRAMKV